MAGRLGESIDFALNYTVGGQENLGAVSERLSALEEAGTNVNIQTERAREILQAKIEAEKEDIAVSEELTVKQFDMATAVSQTNEIVREQAVAMGLLRLEYDEGRISQEEYSNRLAEMRTRLEDAEVVTLSSARTIRQIAAEQRNLNAETQAYSGSLRSNISAVTQTGRIIGSLDGGVSGLARQLPFLAGNLSRVSAAAGGTSAGLSSILGFILTPAGLIVALTALIPIVISVTRRFNLFTKEMVDSERVADGYIKKINELTESILELQNIDADTLPALEVNLDTITRVRDEQEEILETLIEQRREIQASISSGLFSEESAKRLRETHENIAVVKRTINDLTEEQQDIEADIYREKLLQESSVNRSLVDQQRQLQTLETLQELNQMIADQERQLSEQRQQSLDEYYDRAIQRAEELRQKRLEAEQLIRNPPERQQTDDDSTAIQRVLARDRFLEDSRLAMIQNSVNQENAIRLQAQLEFQRRRHELALQGILDDQTLAALRLQIESDAQLQIQDLHQQTADRNLSAWEGFAGAMQGIGQVIAGDSEKNAKKAFEINKALALSSAIAFGASAINRAFAEGGPALAIPVGLAVAANVAKILASKFKGNKTGGGASEKIQYNFRGLQSDNVAGTSVQQTSVNVPSTLRLEDSGGRLLTKLEYMRDREGNDAYAVDNPER